ncbi:MAG: hypothetical protein R3F62_17975 [Planctomycetota bacterium]
MSESRIQGEARWFLCGLCLALPALGGGVLAATGLTDGGGWWLLRLFLLLACLPAGAGLLAWPLVWGTFVRYYARAPRAGTVAELCLGAGLASFPACVLGGAAGLYVDPAQVGLLRALVILFPLAATLTTLALGARGERAEDAAPRGRGGRRVTAPDPREGAAQGRFTLGVLDAAVPLCLLIGGGLSAVSDVVGVAVGLLGVVLLLFLTSWPLFWAGHALASWGAPRSPRPASWRTPWS